MRARIICWVTALLLFPIAARAQATAAPDALIQQAVRGQQLIFARDYPAALALFRQLAIDYPDSPTGTFGELSIWQTRMFENLDYRFAAEYDAALKHHRPIVDAVMAARDPTDWDLFVCGASLGMQGFYLARNRAWLKALGVANRAMQALEKLQWRHPRFIDAQLGLGLYTYWRSVFTKGLRFLPFFRDRRAEGLAQVERVAREGRYAVELAKGNLGFLYAEEKRYAEAAAALGEMLAKYPANIVLRMQLGQVDIEMKEYAKAAAEFRRVMAADPTITKAEFYLGLALVKGGKEWNAANTAFTHYLAARPETEWAAAAHYWLGLTHEKEGDRLAAIAAYRQALDLNPKLTSATAALQRLAAIKSAD